MRPDRQLRVIGHTIFLCICNQVYENLHQTIQIGIQHDIFTRAFPINLDHTRICRPRGGDRLIQHIEQNATLSVQRHLAVFKHRQIQQIVQQARKPDGFGVNNRRVAGLFFRPQPFGVTQNFRKGTDRGHGRAQFMADLA